MSKIYDETAEIVNEINTRLADPAKVFARDDGSTGHKFGNETPLTIQLAYDPTTYKISILVSSTLQKVFAIARQGSELGAWEQLGSPTPWKYASTDDDLSLTVAVANYIPDSGERFIVRCPKRERDERATQDDFYAVNGYSVQTLNTVAMRTLQAPHHSTHENFPGIYLCSDALAGDDYESIQQGKMNVAIPSNVLEWITNDQPKFSFLHHESSTPTWHTLKDPSIRAFDIQIRDHRGRQFDSSAFAELQSH